MRTPHRLLLLTCMTGLAACSLPHDQPAIAPLSTTTLGLGADDGPAIASNWWTAFGDPQLDHLVTEALAGNPTLDLALARLHEAESRILAAGSTRQPQIALDASEQVQRLSNAYIIPPPYGGSTKWVGEIQAGLTWTLDFWGRQADLVRQAQATAAASRLDVEAARLALSASVVQTYFELARAERQTELANAAIRQREEALALARLRLGSALGNRIDLRAAETLLTQAQQALTRAKGQRELAVHALALLAGRGADAHQSIGKTVLSLDDLPELPARLPADLLARRPDILAALARIDAAAAGKAVARKAYYPNVNLVGLAGLQSIGIGRLFSDDAFTAGAGAAIHLPLFQGGRLRADHQQAGARLDQAIALYNNSLLAAVSETADAISRVQTLKADLDAQQRATAGFADMRRLDRIRVQSGLGSRLDLISAEIRLLAARQAMVDIATDRGIAHVRLLIALGGGFAPATPITEDTMRTTG